MAKSSKKTAKKVAKKTVNLPAILPPAKAMSVETGPKLVAAYQKFFSLGNEAKELLDEAMYSRGEAHAIGIPAIIQALKNMPKLSPSDAFRDAREPETKRFYDTLKLATGVLVTDKDGTLVDNPVLAKYFTPRGAEMKKIGKDSEEFKTRKKFTSNFQTFFKDLTQEGVGVLTLKATYKLEPGNVLSISGPKVKEQFGENRVRIDGRREYVDGKRKVKLEVKPSYSAVRDVAAQAYGATLRHNAPARSTGAPIIMNDESFGRMVNGMIESINRLEGKLSDAMRTHLKSLQSTIAKVM
jgi:hypothetical protein